MGVAVLAKKRVVHPIKHIASFTIAKLVAIGREARKSDSSSNFLPPGQEISHYFQPASEAFEVLCHQRVRLSGDFVSSFTRPQASYYQGFAGARIVLAFFQHRQEIPKMVQYFAEGDNLRSHYWKLRKPGTFSSADYLRADLREEGYHFGTESSRERLQYLWCRHERGLISYDQFHVRQLIELCDLRKLEVPSHIRRREGRKGKHKLISLLQDFDDNGGMAFGRLMLLPTELRLQIFQLYIEWQRTNYLTRSGNRFLDLLPLPPLASTARKIRAEFMPLWYENFRWHMFMNGHNYRTHLDITVPQELECDPRAEKAFNHMPLEQLQHMTAIYISARYVVGDKNRFDTWTIDFSKNDRPAVVERAERAYSDSYPTKRSEAERYAHEYIKTEINKLLGRMAERPEGMRLRRED